MLFRTEPSGVLAVSQPAHAWISGQILRAWDECLGESLLLAGEQHDIGWLDWETAPTFNPQTGRPHLFREIGAAVHSPMWRQGVERALAAWGAHVALLISRHGGVIYRRYTDRHRISEADAAAAQTYLETQAPMEAAWVRGAWPGRRRAAKRDDACGACRRPIAGSVRRIENADRPRGAERARRD